VTYDRLWASGILNVGAIAVRELRAFFVSWLGWIVGALIVVPVTVLGYLGPVLGSQSATMDGVFSWVPVWMIFAIPLFTMRLIAEERSTGTLEVTLTAPVRDWELVLGKWLGVLLFYLASVAFTGVYLLLLVRDSAGKLDYGPIATGYIGLLLVGMTFSAIGVLCSSLTRNQIIAAVTAMVALVVLWTLGTLSLFMQPPAGAFFGYAGGGNRFTAFQQGELQLQDVVYFLTLTAGALFLSTRVLDSRRWK
jgi:ABC-2 type transport system permease protein